LETFVASAPRQHGQSPAAGGFAAEAAAGAAAAGRNFGIVIAVIVASANIAAVSSRGMTFSL
jgi:hypothetical protein